MQALNQYRDPRVTPGGRARTMGRGLPRGMITFYGLKVHSLIRSLRHVDWLSYHLPHNNNSPSQSPTPVTSIRRRRDLSIKSFSVLVTLIYSEALARPTETSERQVIVRGQVLPTPSMDGG